MWADSDDEVGRSGFGGKKRNRDYSMPVTFVSGGIKQGSGTIKDSQTASTSKQTDEQDANSRPVSSYFSVLVRAFEAHKYTSS